MLKKLKEKQTNEKRLTIKLLICLIYLIVITLLIVCTYKLYQEKKIIPAWSEVENVEEYTYIEVSKMSEKFAYYEEQNIGIHFVIEKEDTGIWHTYLIAIDESEYDKYKEIIDYTYERTTEVPEPIKVYGYPTIIDEELKNMAIKNIPSFVPAENEVTITPENYESYLTNSYLDTTIEREETFSIPLCITLISLVTVIVLFIITIFDKDKLVDNIDNKISKIDQKTKRILKKRDN